MCAQILIVYIWLDYFLFESDCSFPIIATATNILHSSPFLFKSKHRTSLKIIQQPPFIALHIQNMLKSILRWRPPEDNGPQTVTMRLEMSCCVGDYGWRYEFDLKTNTFQSKLFWTLCVVFQIYVYLCDKVAVMRNDCKWVWHCAYCVKYIKLSWMKNPIRICLGFDEILLNLGWVLQNYFRIVGLISHN